LSGIGEWKAKVEVEEVPEEELKRVLKETEIGI
jgi:hypothetical protein